jgi:hypothetical protein
VDGIYKTLADFRVLISPDGVSQFRVVKQLLTSGLAVAARNPKSVDLSAKAVYINRANRLA